MTKYDDRKHDKDDNEEWLAFYNSGFPMEIQLLLVSPSN